MVDVSSATDLQSLDGLCPKVFRSLYHWGIKGDSPVAELELLLVRSTRWNDGEQSSRSALSWLLYELDGSGLTKEHNLGPLAMSSLTVPMETLTER